MRAALIDPLGQHAGNHQYTDQLARGLTNAGSTVTVYTHTTDGSGSAHRPYEHNETFFGIYGTSHPAIRGLQFLRCLIVTFSEISHRRTDLVHIQLWQHDIREVLQIVFAKVLRKKVVVTLHDVVNFGNNKRARNLEWMLSRADGIVVHNNYCREILMSTFRTSTPVAVIPHVNQAALLGSLPDRPEARGRLNLPHDKIIFLFFGNCRQEKGLDVAMEALSELKCHQDKLLFVTAGKMKAHEEALYRGLADQLELGNLIRMDVGHVSDQDALDYYRAANAVVIPYRQVYESGVAITASSCARAVLASDLPPLLEITENGRLGLHARNGDAHDFALTIEKAMSMDEELDELGAQARDKALRDRDPDVVGARTLAFYEQITSISNEKDGT